MKHDCGYCQIGFYPYLVLWYKMAVQCAPNLSRLSDATVFPIGTGSSLSFYRFRRLPIFLFSVTRTGKKFS